MRRLLLATAAALIAAAGAAYSQGAPMSFFVTSVGSGKGADLGGLKGADAHCASLAEAAGVTGKSWAAYLSTSDTDARDRIGKGPWVNAKGVTIATSVDDLHSDNNKISKETALNEMGGLVNGVGDMPNTHDMLTGSGTDGRLAPPAPTPPPPGSPAGTPPGPAPANMTCNDWTSSTTPKAMLGHHDRKGAGTGVNSWNAVHASRGCSQPELVATGGAGLFYCFATK